MKTWAATTWYGRAIWLKPPEVFSRQAQSGDSMRVLHYLEVTQEADGRWPQNMWLDGRPYWSGSQMDEAAFPILLVDLIRREAPSALGDMKRWWNLVRKAAGFLAANGPVTQQDRWEEDAGYSPFTLAVEIAGLLAAADLADAVGKNRRRRICEPSPTTGMTISNAGLTPSTDLWPGQRELRDTTSGSRRRRPMAPLPAGGVRADQEPATGERRESLR